jgi:DNA-binding NarL/FixJ family response regulator
MISILIAEDEKPYKKYLAELIEKEPEFSLVGCVDSISTLTRSLSELRPDVLLLDLNLHQENSLNSIADFVSLSPETRICVLSILNDEDALIKALRAGAKGYIVKGGEETLLIQEIKTLHLGGSPLTTSLAQKLIGLLSPTKPDTSFLTERQMEILQRIALGFDYKDIAEDLSISPQTVRTHIRNIYNALEVSSKREAIKKGRKLGIFPFLR